MIISYANHSILCCQGDIIRKMGNLKLASFCISQLAEIRGAVGQSPMQQAIVLSFLKKYDQASDVRVVVSCHNSFATWSAVCKEVSYDSN